MHGTFFYIGLGAGLAAACGLRPFLPVLLAGALATAPALGLSFSHDPFRFLQADWWLLVVVVALVLAYVLQLLMGMSALPQSGAERGRPDPLAAALSGLAYGAGAVLFAGTLAAHGDAWWPGLIGGVVVVGLTQRAAGPVLTGARARLPDRPAREALTLYLDAAAL
ncbi:MAG TPA: DUF4126 family protein, partial [Solirubrobacteraceae bacterium]|nr:DUF4126 family protein [Solirubrobacteraceae bacterium]